VNSHNDDLPISVRFLIPKQIPHCVPCWRIQKVDSVSTKQEGQYSNTSARGWSLASSEIPRRTFVAQFQKVIWPGMLQ